MTDVVTRGTVASPEIDGNDQPPAYDNVALKESKLDVFLKGADGETKRAMEWAFEVGVRSVQHQQEKR